MTTEDPPPMPDDLSDLDGDTPPPKSAQDLIWAAGEAWIEGDEARAIDLERQARELQDVEDLEKAREWNPKTSDRPLEKPKPLPAVAANPIPRAELNDELDRLEKERDLEELTRELSPNIAKTVARLRSKTMTGLDIANIPPPEPLIDGFLSLNSLAILYGPPAAGKSLLTLDWAASVATGAWWNGQAVRRGPVLYVVAEGAAGMGARLTAWAKRAQVFGDLFRDLHWLVEAPNLFDRDSAAAFTAYAAAVSPSLIILDTFARCIVGADENSARDAGVVIGNLERLREATGATVLSAHHTPKSGEGIRGSTAIEGAVDTAIELKQTDGVVTLSLTKQKNGPILPERRFAIVGEEDSVILHPSTGLAREVSLEELPRGYRQALQTVLDLDTGDGVSYTDWADAAPVAKSTVARSRKVLLDLGAITEEKVGRSKRYAITEAGTAVLSST